MSWPCHACHDMSWHGHDILYVYVMTVIWQCHDMSHDMKVKIFWHKKIAHVTWHVFCHVTVTWLSWQSYDHVMTCHDMSWQSRKCHENVMTVIWHVMTNVMTNVMTCHMSFERADFQKNAFLSARTSKKRVFERADLQKTRFWARGPPTNTFFKMPFWAQIRIPHKKLRRIR